MCACDHFLRSCLRSPLKRLSRLSQFLDGVDLMDKGGVQFYFDDKVVLHNSGAVLGGREGMQEIGERKEGCGEEGRRRRVWMRKEETRGGNG